MTAALLFLGIVSAMVYAARRRFPYAPVECRAWALMLAPYSALIETGAQAHTWTATPIFPQIGLYIVGGRCGVADLSMKWE